MLSIGEFARLAGVSVRMLRHYDAIGLLAPERVDPYTGYRSYSVAQLDLANRLVALKELGFSLDEVAELLADTRPERITELLFQRRDALQAQLRADRDRLAAVDARLRTLRKEDTVSDYTITTLPALRVVQLSTHVRDVAEVEPSIGPLFDRVNAAIDAAGAVRVGPGVATYTPTEEGMIAAAAEQIGSAATPDGLESAEVAGVDRALTVVYEGDDLAGLPAAWQNLVREADRRGDRPVGVCREVYLTTPFDGPNIAWKVSLEQPIA